MSNFNARMLIASLMGAFSFNSPLFVPRTTSAQKRSHIYTNAHSRKVNKYGENQAARDAGIPKCLRQYAKRYGGLDVAGILQIDRQQRGITPKRP